MGDIEFLQKEGTAGSIFPKIRSIGLTTARMLYFPADN